MTVNYRMFLIFSTLCIMYGFVGLAIDDLPGNILRMRIFIILIGIDVCWMIYNLFSNLIKGP